MAHAGGPGRGDGMTHVTGADAGSEQEKPVGAGERGRQRGRVVEVAADALGAGGQPGGPGGIADKDAEGYTSGVEFAGPLVGRMPMAERLVLCNMVIDFGAKTGYIQPDETTARAGDFAPLVRCWALLGSRPVGYDYAAAIVRRISSSECAVETNAASNCDGARYTPRSSMAWKKAA